MIFPDSLKHLAGFVIKMENAGMPPAIIDAFEYYYTKVVRGETGLLFEQTIRPVNKNDIQEANNLKEYAGAGKQALKKCVMIMLNGGLGTSMGLTRAKSLIKVKNGQSFLEILIGLAEKQQTRLALMNSFSTDKDTRSSLATINPSRMPLLFRQHQFPKILCDQLAPAAWEKNPKLEWNPPGHGDVYLALYTSRILQQLIEQGIVFALISNSDNLGATIDIPLLGYFSKNGFPFMMEVAERTPSDRKGGHLARHKNGRLILRETAQCPENELAAFQDINRYRFFNTNNIWINLLFLKKYIEKYGTIQLPMILNPKTLDPRDPSSPKVYQIETAMGAAIHLFERATAVKVPRSRFFPVKKCNDLLAVRSDCFLLSPEKKLILNPARKAGYIKIKLDPQYYGKIDMFNERFINGIPSLIDCERLTVKGDVLFEENVTLKGNVFIKNSGKSQAVIKKGSVLSGELIL